MKERYFLGYQKDQSAAAAEKLHQIFPDTLAGIRDFSSVLAVMPGRSAIRRLAAVLGNSFPPAFRTAGSLLQKQEKQTDIEQNILWQKVLQNLDQHEYSNLFPLGFDERNPVQVRTLAEQFHQLRTTLTGNLYSIGDAAHILSEQKTADYRWDELASLEQLFLQELANADLQDPLEELRRLVSDPAPFRAYTHIILIGMPDLPQAVRQLLGMLEQNGFFIHIFIFAPETHRIRFDEWGCVLPESWSGYPLAFPPESLHAAHDPAGIASTAGKIIAAAPSFCPDKYRFAVTDKKYVSFLKNELKNSIPDVIFYDPSGISAGKLRIASFLRCLTDLTEEAAHPSAASVREIFQNPDSLRFLAGKNGQDRLLSAADRYFSEHLPETLHPNSPQAEDILASAFQTILEWRRMLLESAGMTETVRTILDSVFPPVWEPPPKHHVLFADEAETVRGALQYFERSSILRTLTGHEYLTALTGHLSQIQLYPIHAPDAVEVPGFLDLPSFPAENVIVCGMNEGLIPESFSPTPYLSDSKRKLLKLPDNALRYARDCFYMDRLLALYPDIHFISCKTDENGAPLRFPTLYFTGAEPEDLFRRIQILFAPAVPDPLPEYDFHFKFTPDTARAFPAEDGIAAKLSVTDFKEILSSPIRAFFSRSLRMEELDPAAVEMNPAVLGTLCHKALQQFNGTDPEELVAVFQQKAEKIFGLPLPLPVRIQCEMFAQRLRKSAKILTETETAYPVLAKEWRLNDGKGILFRDILIKGTIDRIEYGNGELRLIDFKTKNTPESPKKAHLRNGKLINLQLPLYILLLREDPVFRQKFPGIDLNQIKITCGYFCITKAVSEIGYSMWSDMDDTILDMAEKTVDEVLETILLLRQGISTEDPDKKISETDPFRTILKPSMRDAVSGICWKTAEQDKEGKQK